MKIRKEKDLLGEVQIPAESYRGIHTERALANFKVSGLKTPVLMIKAMAMVKKAACRANNELGFIDDKKAAAITDACDEIYEGRLDDEFFLDALQGGAGTSTNMNVNEVIANRALELLGKPKGSYETIDPIGHINLHQSTNDVYPTALKIASIYGLQNLSDNISRLQGALQEKEKEFRDILTIGRTEMQDAVPMTLGSQFASFADAIARDRWRTFKSEERLRVVNIGGTAIGTGLTAPRKYIFLVIEKLRQEAGLGLTRAEQPMDATANADVFIEVSGMLSAHAANIKKICLDLRHLHSLNEIILPAVQAGSSIMPGKINPVIMESAISAAIKVFANDFIIKDCVSSGTLQINEFMPLIAYSLLESLEILWNTNKMLLAHIKEINADSEACRRNFNRSEALITAFLPLIGYSEAEKLLEEFHNSSGNNFREFLESKLGSGVVAKTLSPASLLSLGYHK